MSLGCWEGYNTAEEILMKNQTQIAGKCLLVPSFSLPYLLVLPGRLFTIRKIIMKSAKDVFSGLRGACLSRALSHIMSPASECLWPGLPPLCSCCLWPLCPIPLFFLHLCLPKTVSGELNSRFQTNLHRAAHRASPCSSHTYCLSCEPWGYFWKPECQNKLASCVRPGADGSLTSCSLALISHFEALNVRSSINIFIIAFLLCSYLGYRCVGANIPFLLFLKKKNISRNDKFLHL